MCIFHLLLPLLLHISTSNSTSIVQKWHYANSNSSTHDNSKRTRAIKLSSDNNEKSIHHKKEEKKFVCEWGRERENHINVFRSGLKVLYLVAMHTVSIERSERINETKKRDPFNGNNGVARVQVSEKELGGVESAEDGYILVWLDGS